MRKHRRRNNCGLLDVGHVYNVPGTMESCPTYFCLSPKHRNVCLSVVVYAGFVLMLERLQIMNLNATGIALDSESQATDRQS